MISRATRSPPRSIVRIWSTSWRSARSRGPARGPPRARDGMKPTSIDDTIRALDERGYIATHELATSVFLALRLQRALLLEGEAGVGKTELARALASVLEAPLIRLQCYEGLDAAQALYDWDYARQMLEIRLLEAGGERDTQRV